MKIFYENTNNSFSNMDFLVGTLLYAYCFYKNILTYYDMIFYLNLKSYFFKILLALRRILIYNKP